MFPGTAVMYWLGTRGIHGSARAAAQRGRGVLAAAASTTGCCQYGAIPVALIARLMLDEGAGR